MNQLPKRVKPCFPFDALADLVAELRPAVWEAEDAIKAASASPQLSATEARRLRAAADNVLAVDEALLDCERALRNGDLDAALTLVSASVSASGKYSRLPPQ